MRSLVIHSAKDLRIEETSVSATAPGEIKIRLANGGICGSDLHYYQHGGIGDAIRLKEPMILGHEVSGFVSDINSTDTDLSVGDLVSVSPSRPCHACTFCHEGFYNHCENMRFYGSAMPYPHIQGAFREELVADVSQCVKANGLTPAEAAMAEPLAVCLHAVRRAGDLNGKRVLITGSGPIGTLTVLAARAAGAKEIVTTDLAATALDYAARVGADKTININAEPDGLAQFQIAKGHFDALFECTGVASALASGIKAVRPRGVVVQLGLGGDMQIPMQALTAKELDLKGSFRFHEEFGEAVEQMLGGNIDVKPLISHTFGVDQAVAAFELAADRSTAMKVHIDFSA